MKKLLNLAIVMTCVLALTGCVQSGDGGGEPVAGGADMPVVSGHVQNNEQETTQSAVQPSDEEIDKINEQDENWGISISATNVTQTGLVIVCTQSDGEPKGELQTSSYYNLSKYENDSWVEVGYLPQDHEVIWTEESFLIPLSDTVKLEVDWEWLYGELPQGEYRISKSVMDFIETGDYKEQTFYATFEIE